MGWDDDDDDMNFNFDDLSPEENERIEREMREKDEKTSGRLYVNFSAKGDEGSHIVCLRLKGPDGQNESGQIWVKYSSLTRTFEYGDKKLTWDKVGE